MNKGWNGRTRAAKYFSDIDNEIFGVKNYGQYCNTRQIKLIFAVEIIWSRLQRVIFQCVSTEVKSFLQ